MNQLSKIFSPHTKQSGSVKFRIASDIVICVGMKLFPFIIWPLFFCLISSLNVYGWRIPILFFTRNIVSPFQEQNLFTGRRQLVRQSAATCAGSDDDYVIPSIRCHNKPSQLLRFARHLSADAAHFGIVLIAMLLFVALRQNRRTDSQKLNKILCE